ncbi:hypothetical protein QCA50_015149 [Cerrena zonata]|uniref:DNA2/NAM7 helicase-like C-terminal domain-containing protein n=1 Tax=Cerrena zonata TaxID=2478898 RepID=A0AAW0FNT6_9APHY
MRWILPRRALSASKCNGDEKIDAHIRLASCLKSQGPLTQAPRVQIFGGCMSHSGLQTLFKSSYKEQVCLGEPSFTTMTTSVAVRQDIFKKSYPSITVISIEEHLLTNDYLKSFLAASHSTTLGLSAIYEKKCKLSHLAIATASVVLLVRLPANRPKTSKRNRKSPLEESILCSTRLTKLSFDAEHLATALFLDHDYHINDVVDIDSLVPKTETRGSTAALHKSLGGQECINEEGVMCAFRRSHQEKSQRNKCLALRAWSSCIIAALPEMVKALPAARTIDTLNMPPSELRVLARSVRDHDRLVALKPLRAKNDISPKAKFSKGKLQLDLTRFKTRMRKSDTQTVEVKFSDGDKTSNVFGRVTRVKGKSAQVLLKGAVQRGTISVSTLGKDDPTNLEMERIDVTLTCLQNNNALFRQDLAAWIFLARKLRASPSSSQPSIYPSGKRELNNSQNLAVKHVLSKASSDRVCLIQGPPGTGKTTVIAASVRIFLANPTLGLGSCMWLMAQSNVAVKNIAEKLADNDMLDFILLVSLDFHFQWHEHLYSKIEANVIRSDKFSPRNAANTMRRLAGSRVILCTLSMLSHPALDNAGVFETVPVDTVILDEASQIEVGDYLPLLSRFGRGLRKLAFIGDDKQLAPFGQDDIGHLRSVFELHHLQPNVVFLDTQYRMPTPVGDFLSSHVYDKKLQSKHDISTRKSCRLVDIRRGQETKSGNSWVNKEEVQAVIHIARKYQKEGKDYRIITPYDAQRNAIEKSLKSANMNWEDKCFNVDSFQGNEADHIVISVVRSDKVGFLKNLRRSNVMLSRCKQSMTICTNRRYLEGVASDTLLGKLAKEWGAAGRQWLTWRDVLAGRF